MDKNSLIGLLLIGVILVGTTYFLQPEQPAQQDRQATEKQDDVREEAPQRATQKPQTADEVEPEEKVESGKNLGKFSNLQEGTEKEITVENELLKLVFTNKGGTLKKVLLKEYNTYEGEPVSLIRDGNSKLSYKFFHENKKIETADLFFEFREGQSQSISGNDSLVIRLRASIGDGQYMEQVYTIHGKKYTVDYHVDLVGFDKIMPKSARYYELDWKSTLLQQEKSLSDEQEKSTIYFKFLNDSPDYLSETKSDDEDLPNQVHWVSFKQKFFTKAIIAPGGFERGSIEVDRERLRDGEVAKMYAGLSIPFEHLPSERQKMQLFFGPNHYKVLSSLNVGLEDQIPLGWGIFGWINKYLVINVFNFLDSFIASYGIIILLLTIFIKLLVTPFTYKSYISSAKMRVLKPELDKLKEKYGKDMTKLQSEQMKLYRQTGVNMFGGCLPLLLQFPFLIAMFRFFPASIELRHESFLWAEDLSSYDSIFDFPGGFSIPFYGDHVSLFTLLMAGSTVLYAKLNAQNQTSAMNNEMQAMQMKMLMYVMPLVLLPVFNNYASGLSYYYLVYNVLSFAQMYGFRKLVDEDKIRKQLEENKVKRKHMKKSKFQMKLEEMAKKQEEMKRQQQGGKKKKK